MTEYILEVTREDESFFLRTFDTYVEALDAQRALEDEDIFGRFLFSLVYKRRRR